MKREDIEKAAKGAAIEVGYDAKLIADIPGRTYYEHAFKKGAEWRINSVWHDASEVPEEHRFCLYILKDGTYGCGYYHKEDNSIWYSRFTNIVKWAYFQDITPNMED